MRNKKVCLSLLLLLLFAIAKAQINTPTPTIPFGTNTSYAGGILPSNRSVTDAQKAYTDWKNNYVRACNNDSQYRVLFDDGSSTVSEGIGYGMLLAAYAGDKALLDGLWAYYKANSQNSYGMMDWKISGCSGVTGSGPATDADEDCAWALIVAEYQWPNDNSKYDYGAEATALITKIGNSEITGGQANNGASWGSTNTCRNPSYQAPAYYRQFASQVSSQSNLWNTAVTNSFTLLNNNVNTSTGLVSNWCNNSGQPNDCNNGSNGTPEYGYDACRNPWRMAMDVIWNNTSSTQTNFCNRLASYISQKGATSVGGNVPQSGGTGNHYPCYIATFAAGLCGASSSYQSIIDQMYTETLSKTDSPPLYYGNTLRCLALFMMTGNFWKPGATTNTGVTVSITSPTNGTSASEGSNITLTATASTTTGSISKVEFFAGTTKIGEATSSPYTITWSNVPAGSYSITAVATNSSGKSATSGAVTVNVLKSIYQTTTPPTIDGTADALWTSHVAASMDKVLTGTVTTSDLSGNWKACWDATNLYVLVTVTDDAKVNNGGTDTYNDDEVEVYIDIGNDKASSYGTNDFQYTFRWNDATLVRETHGRSVTGIVRATTNTTTGYVTEISIPWSTLTGSPAVNQLVGFDVMVNDDDDGGARDAKISWSAATDDAWTNPSVMGTVILKGTNCTAPGAAGTIAGPASPCAGSTGNVYSIPAVTGATSYTWTLPAGATITGGSGSNSITVTMGSTAGSISVTPANTCGNGTASSKTISVGTLPSAAGTITGNSAPCAGTTGLIYSIASVSGATSYTWTVPSGATITGGTGTNSITVTMGSANGTITVTPVNSCGNGTSKSLAVTVGAVPGAAGTISGTNTPCASSTGNVYSIAAVTGATSYNWTLPSGAAITSGSGSNNVTVTMGTANGTISVTPVNTCGNGTASSRSLTLGTLPAAAGTITGPAQPCAGSTGNIYSIASVNGATSYNWTIPAGAAITAGSGTNSITVTMGTTGGNVTVTPVNACGNGTSATLGVTISGTPGIAGTISGPATPCAGSTGNVYSIAAVTGASSYNWTLPAGATLTGGSGTNSITVTFGTTSGNVTVTPVNQCGVTGTASSKAITVKNIPGAPGAIAGPAAPCPGSTGNVYSIAAVTDADTYTWTVPAGATITAGATSNSITVTMGTTTGNVTVKAANTCGTGTAASLSVTPTSSVGTAGTISGPSAPCPASAGNVFSIAPVSGASSYNWTIPAGATITSGAGTNQVTVTMGSVAGNISVTPTGSCGTGTASSKALSLGTAPGAAGTISGPASVCASSTGNVYSIAAVTGATSYNWTVPSGATITSGAGTGSIAVTFGATGGNVTVTPVNTCGNGTSASLAVAVSNLPAAPVSISGPLTPCAGSSGNIYSVAPVSNTDSYTWTAPAGATIASGNGSNTISLSMGAASGTITVKAVNNCGVSNVASLNISPGSTPAAAGTISGPSSPCANSAGNTYSIANVQGATSYNWTVPAGATITGGSGTNSITISWGTTAGTISVIPVNACGNGTSSSLAVALASSVANAGTISGPASPCANASVVYSVAAVSGASTYNWTFPAGTVITSGAGTNSVTVTMGTTGGNISVVPSGSCGTATASNKTISIGNVPADAGTISGPASACNGSSGNTYSIAAVSGATSYTWTLPDGAVISSGESTNVISVTFGTSSGTITVKPVNGCGEGTSSSTTVTLTSDAPIANAGPDQYISVTTATLAANAAGSATGQWTVESGTAVFVNANSPTTSISGLSVGENILKWTITGSCSASSDKVSIFVGGVPPTSSISGPANVTTGSTGVTYSVTDHPGSTYTWTVPAGATIVSGQGTNSIVVDFGNTGGTVSVTESNPFGTGTPSSMNVVVGDAPVTSSISGNTNVTPGQTGVTYSVTNNPGSTYTWTVPDGATIVSGQGTSSIVVDFGGSGGAVSVVETNQFGQGTAVSTNVSMPSGVKTVNAIGKVDVYPNPFTEETTILFSTPVTSGITLRVTDIHGKELMRLDNQLTNEEIHLGNDLPQGVYLIQATQEDKVQVIRLVKMK